MSPPTARAMCITATSKSFCPPGPCFAPDNFDSKDDFLFLNEVFR